MSSTTGISTAFLGALLAAVFDGRFFLAVDFREPPRACLTLDFTFFGAVRFAPYLRAGLALALPRFGLFLRVAAPFRALAMVISREVLLPVNKPTHNSQGISSASG